MQFKPNTQQIIKRFARRILSAQAADGSIHHLDIERALYSTLRELVELHLDEARRHGTLTPQIDAVFGTVLGYLDWTCNTPSTCAKPRRRFRSKPTGRA